MSGQRVSRVSRGGTRAKGGDTGKERRRGQGERDGGDSFPSHATARGGESGAKREGGRGTGTRERAEGV